MFFSIKDMSLLFSSSLVFTLSLNGEWWLVWRWQVKWKSWSSPAMISLHNGDFPYRIPPLRLLSSSYKNCIRLDRNCIRFSFSLRFYLLLFVSHFLYRVSSWIFPVFQLIFHLSYDMNRGEHSWIIEIKFKLILFILSILINKSCPPLLLLIDIKNRLTSIDLKFDIQNILRLPSSFILIDDVIQYLYTNLKATLQHVLKFADKLTEEVEKVVCGKITWTGYYLLHKAALLSSLPLHLAKPHQLLSTWRIPKALLQAVSHNRWPDSNWIRCGILRSFRVSLASRDSATTTGKVI